MEIDDSFVTYYLNLYRWFTSVETEKELNSLISNTYINPLDIVYCREVEKYYVYTPYDTWEVLSAGNQHFTKFEIFHLLNIGDTVKLGGNEFKVVDISFTLKSSDAFYDLMDVRTEQISKVLVSVVDGQLIEEGIPMQSLLLVSGTLEDCQL